MTRHIHNLWIYLEDPIVKSLEQWHEAQSSLDFWNAWQGHKLLFQVTFWTLWWTSICTKYLGNNRAPKLFIVNQWTDIEVNRVEGLIGFHVQLEHTDSVKCAICVCRSHRKKAWTTETLVIHSSSHPLSVCFLNILANSIMLARANNHIILSALICHFYKWKKGIYCRYIYGLNFCCIGAPPPILWQIPQVPQAKP